MKSVYKVSIVSLKSCLVNIPLALTRSLSNNNIAAQDVVVVITEGSKVACAGWTGHTSGEQNSVELDPAYARDCGLNAGAEVKIEVKHNVRNAEVVWVEPVSADDWEMMELHASFLELNLLNQIRAVSIERPLTVYLNAYTTASIVVKKIEPELAQDEPFAKLSTSAEVVVSPKTRQPAQDRSSAGRSIRSNRPRPATATKQNQAVFLRAVDETASELPGLNATIPASIWRTALGLSKYVEIQVILPQVLRRKAANPDMIAPPLPDKNKPQEVVTQVASKLIVRAQPSESIYDKHIGCPTVIMKALNIEVGSRIRIAVAHSPKKLNAITFHCLVGRSKQKEIKIGSKKDEELLDRFKTQLSSIGEGPVSHGLLLDDFVVGLQKEGDWLALPSIDKLSITQGEDIIRPELAETSLQSSKLRGVDSVISKITKICSRHGGVLLHGSRGCGKSALTQGSACILRARDRMHVVTADCSKLAEERIPTIKETLNHWFSEAAWYEPSVISLDDLDRLCSAEVEHADSTRARQVAEIFLSVVRQFSSRHNIAILATSQSRESVHSLLTTSHIFDEIIPLKPPNKLARKDIVQSLVDDEQGKVVDWLAVANITDGYLAGDLKFLSDRAKHEGLMREMRENEDSGAGLLQTVDYTEAIRGFIPASLRGIKLQKSSVEWKDIGGLEETRRILLETLEWPTRYAPIFANCPLRLRSGLLLYGYPGCGKTLLASAVASECGLNFISVKGPEILNKYIGASEKSVRDLFDRAQAAKPCILFFDEFDSIAPKRGHDSTGVTDRVVNQMLTQMDGAEGLDGVYVLAATSRPDLIDPALLRPGRLDKSLLCNMPSHTDRLSILAALSRKMHMSRDVDLERLAGLTDGFSGADLQAVLYNAHLEAIHDHLAHTEEQEAAAMMMSSSEQLDSRKDSLLQRQPTTFTRFRLGDGVMKGMNGIKTSADLAAVTARVEAILENAAATRHGHTDQLHATTDHGTNAPAETAIELQWHNLTKSLETTRPSISLQERRRLDRVYHDFVDGRSADGLPDGQGAPGEQRATLA